MKKGRHELVCRSNFHQDGIQENVDFVGRRTELAKMARQLRRRNVAITHVPGGKCGIGKTQLAIAYAFKHMNKYDGVWWLVADKTRLKGSTGELARMLNPELPENVAYTECCGIIRECLSDGRRHLLILDNLECADNLDDLRLTGPSRLLVTTRFASVSARRFRNLQLTDLDRHDAIALLRKHCDKLNDDRQLDALAEYLGDHALALALAGSYLAQYPDVSPKVLLENLRGPDNTVLDDPELLKAGDYTRRVAQTLMLHVPEDLGSSLRGRILSTAAFCHPDAIPVELFAAVLGQTAVEITKELAMLKKLSVLQYSGDCVSLHWLTQTVLRARLTPEQRAAQLEAIRAAAAARFHYDIAAEPARWPEMHRWLPHVLTVLDRVPNEGQNAAWAFVANQAGFFLNTHARRQEALRYLYKAEHIDRNALGNFHPDVARDVNNIGLVLRSIGKQKELERALPRFREAKGIYRKVFGDEHADVARTLNYLGLVLRAQSKLEKALGRFCEAEKIYRAVFSDMHSDVAITLNNIGLVLKDQDKFDKAHIKLDEAERIDRHVFGNDHPNVARDVNSRGTTFWKEANTSLSQANKRHKLKEALCRFQEAKTIYHAEFGDMHSKVAMTLNNIGLVLKDQGNYGKAFGCLRKAEKIWRQILGNEHPEVANCVYNIGVVKQAQRNLAGARKCYREALKIYYWNGYDKTHYKVRPLIKNLRSVGMWRMFWEAWWKISSIRGIFTAVFRSKALK